MKNSFRELTPEEMRKSCDPDSLGFETTEDLSAGQDTVLSQDRAVKAILFGVGMDGLDYNIFVAGHPKTGLTYITKTLIEQIALKKSPPPDWCYVHNFREPDRPKALSLPSGRAREFKKDIEELITDVRNDIPDVFESEDYSAKRDELLKKFNVERSEILSTLEEKVLKDGFILNVSQVGMVIMPARDGQPMDEETLKSLDDESKKQLREKSEILQAEMNQVVRSLRAKEKELKNSLKDLDKNIALYAIGHCIEDLNEKYNEFPQVLSYLQEIKDDMIMNLDDFKAKAPAASPFPMPLEQPSFTRYEVNLLVDQSETKGAPVIYESNPTYPNLFGSIERKSQFGALFTDFTMIRPGSLHKANGGFLIIKAIDLLRTYFSWEGLKRALRNKEIKVEELWEQLGYIVTKSLKPEPIPLRVKILLIGEPYIYQILYDMDPDFTKMFKIKAQLDNQMEREDNSVKNYTYYIARRAKKNNLIPVHKSAVARLIEYGSELSGRNYKLSLEMAEINNLLKEGAYFASLDHSPHILGEHIDKAIEEKIYRSNLYEERIQEAITLGTLKIDADGFKKGQINGLSVYSMGDYMFGRPSRITVNISLGKEGVVDIEREAKLSGNIHTKGVMILGGYLRGTYAADKPLSLSASITFEQNYGMVDGDSASGAELLALLSALAEVSLYQGIAVTGSVSQKGESLPIGGVNEKIEGFFEVCRDKGLTGRQGVIIPESNIKDLMLKKKVVEAVREGRFHIYPINHIEEALEILTGKKAGKKKKDGTYPKGTLNALIEAKLKAMNDIVKEVMGPKQEDRRDT